MSKPEFKVESYSFSECLPLYDIKTAAVIKIVFVPHRDIEDPDHGGTYTVKTYHSEKIEEDGVLGNQRIVLKPETNADGYSPIVVEDVSDELVVVGEFLSVLW